ncbi:MAG: methyltransferase domain-containing protein [Rubrivivax sp.]|nr:methyltransferase domain-containing protein [Rubrivivax sp.]
MFPVATAAAAAAPTELHAPAHACPAGFDTERLRREIVAQYERVAAAPAHGEHHFHTGGEFAVRALGYDAGEIARLPLTATDRFAGVGNPLLAGPLPDGGTVLDHACGAGTDLLLAATRVGPRGTAIGVDMTPGMRECARRAAEEAGLAGRVEVVDGRFEALPLPDASVDVVLSNGVLNLAPDKLAVLAEAWRVLRPGGALYLADVVLARPLDELARANPALWAACIGGALHEPLLGPLLAAAGFVSVQVAARHDPFAGTALGAKLGRAVGLSSLTLAARKPG